MLRRRGAVVPPPSLSTFFLRPFPRLCGATPVACGAASNVEGSVALTAWMGLIPPTICGRDGQAQGRPRQCVARQGVHPRESRTDGVLRGAGGREEGGDGGVCCGDAQAARGRSPAQPGQSGAARVRDSTDSFLVGRSHNVSCLRGGAGWCATCARTSSSRGSALRSRPARSLSPRGECPHAAPRAHPDGPGHPLGRTRGRSISWVPDHCGWRLNVARKDLRKSTQLAKFFNVRDEARSSYACGARLTDTGGPRSGSSATTRWATSRARRRSA